MFQLYQHALCPHSRFIRLVLGEKQIEFEKIDEPFWQRREAFMRLSPAGTTPVLAESGQHFMTDAAAIAGYLEETSATPPLMTSVPRERAEARRLMHWFLYKFHEEVSGPLLTERLWKRLATRGMPEAAVLRNAAFNARYHVEYLKFLTERRTWLAGDALTLADLAAAAMLSSLDYLGSVPWDIAGEAKEWYAKIKCRPSFRLLLADHVPGLPPAAHYTNLDF